MARSIKKNYCRGHLYGKNHFLATRVGLGVAEKKLRPKEFMVRVSGSIPRGFEGFLIFSFFFFVFLPKWQDNSKIQLNSSVLLKFGGLKIGSDRDMELYLAMILSTFGPSKGLLVLIFLSSREVKNEFNFEVVFLINLALT